MQALAGLVTILKKYKLELSPDTPTKVEFEPRSFVTQAKREIRLKFIPRDGQESIVFAK